MNINQINNISQKIMNNLSQDLLSNKFKGEIKNNYSGHCYLASETLFHLTGGKDVWLVRNARDSDNIVHWWLINKESNDIVDLTKRQYTDFNIKPPYENGKPGFFLTKKPSKRCLQLINKIFFN